MARHRPLHLSLGALGWACRICILMTFQNAKNGLPGSNSTIKVFPSLEISNRRFACSFASSDTFATPSSEYVAFARAVDNRDVTSSGSLASYSSENGTWLTSPPRFQMTRSKVRTVHLDAFSKYARKGVSSAEICAPVTRKERTVSGQDSNCFTSAVSTPPDRAYSRVSLETRNGVSLRNGPTVEV